MQFQLSNLFEYFDNLYLLPASKSPKFESSNRNFYSVNYLSLNLFLSISALIIVPLGYLIYQESVESAILTAVNALDHHKQGVRSATLLIDNKRNQ